MKIILIAIILVLVAVVGYTGAMNSKALDIIEQQQQAITEQQKVITFITGVTIPKGSVVTPSESPPVGQAKDTPTIELPSPIH